MTDKQDKQHTCNVSLWHTYITMVAIARSSMLDVTTTAESHKCSSTVLKTHVTTINVNKHVNSVSSTVQQYRKQD